MQVPTITDSASASGKANPSTLCVRWLKARSDHGHRTSTTRCTWTDSPRSSEDNRLIPADPNPKSGAERRLGAPSAGMPGRRSAFGYVSHEAHDYEQAYDNLTARVAHASGNLWYKSPGGTSTKLASD